jgi:hypothetical protein
MSDREPDPVLWLVREIVRHTGDTPREVRAYLSAQGIPPTIFKTCESYVSRVDASQTRKTK